MYSLPCSNSLNDLHNITAFINGAKRTSTATGTALHTFRSINLCFSVCTRMDSIKSTGSLTRPTDLNNSSIRTDFFTHTTFNAFCFIYIGSILMDSDSLLRTFIHAFMGYTVPASVSDQKFINWTLVTSFRQDINNRQRFINRLC